MVVDPRLVGLLIEFVAPLLKQARLPQDEVED